MELNIKEFRISGDGSDSSPMGFFEPHQSSLYPLFKSDSTYKSTFFNSKEEPFNSNNELILDEKESKKINTKYSQNIIKEENNISNNVNRPKIKNQKEKNMTLLGQEKSKINKKEPIYALKKVEIPPKEENKVERTDRNGTVINKKNRKKVKISFIDQVDKHKKLVTEVKIESFKKYNIILGMPKEDYYDGNDKNNSKCSCICLII